MNKALLSSKRMDWGTPQEFYDKLNAEFGFDLDAAATPENAKHEYNKTRPYKHGKKF